MKQPLKSPWRTGALIGLALGILVLLGAGHVAWQQYTDSRADWSASLSLGTLCAVLFGIAAAAVSGTVIWLRSLSSGHAEFQELITIYRAADGVHAHLVRGFLEQHDIPVSIQGEALAGAIGELPPTLLDVEVQVPPRFAEQARRLALEFDSNSPTGRDT